MRIMSGCQGRWPPQAGGSGFNHLQTAEDRSGNFGSDDIWVLTSRAVETASTRCMGWAGGIDTASTCWVGLDGCMGWVGCDSRGGSHRESCKMRACNSFQTRAAADLSKGSSESGEVRLCGLCFFRHGVVARCIICLVACVVACCLSAALQPRAEVRPPSLRAPPHSIGGRHRAQNHHAHRASTQTSARAPGPCSLCLPWHLGTISP